MSSVVTTTDVLVIGGGQAGLATGRMLQKSGLSFIILEATEEPVGSWLLYYDSLTLFSPARYSSMPDLPFPGDRDAYPTKDEVTNYLRTYVRTFGLPVRTGQRVTSVRVLDADGFSVSTATGNTFNAGAVVVASGTFGAPYIPQIDGMNAYRGQLLHSCTYVRPDAFEGQRVVVVGAANSAVQIAVELTPHADVTIATREPVRYAPQRLLGRDVHFWFGILGIDATNWFSDQGTPVLDDGYYRTAIKSGKLPRRVMFRAFTGDGVTWADGTDEHVDAVIMATGYRSHIPFLSGLPILDAKGQLDQRAGAARQVPGLYFVGQPGLCNFASGTLRGVGTDAKIVADHIQRRRKGQKRAPHSRNLASRALSCCQSR